MYFFLKKYWAMRKSKTKSNSGQLKECTMFLFLHFYSVKPLYFSCKVNTNLNIFHFTLSDNSTLRENCHKSLSEFPSLQCQKAIMYVVWMKKDEDVVCWMNLFLKYVQVCVNCFPSQKLMIYFAYETFSCQLEFPGKNDTFCRKFLLSSRSGQL